MKLILSAADLFLAALMLIFGPFAWLVARLSRYAPLSHRALEIFRVGVLRHYYHEPLVFERDLKRPLDQERNIVGLDLNELAQSDLVAKFEYGDELLEIPLVPSNGKYGYRNGMFEQGDGECYYSMIRYFKPKRIIEIGAGHSTLVAELAIAKNRTEDASYKCNHRVVEPYENKWLSRTGVEIVRKPVEDLPPGWVNDLESGDILFIDSSHVIRPQGDVLHLYLEILGKLNRGVIVYIHDIFTPRDYLRQWVVNQHRLWNEQYLLESFLSFNREFSVLFALNWQWHNRREDIARIFPVLATTPDFEPGSFCIRRN
jgi:hypothetical protein